MELDHLFVCTEPGAPAADALVQFGLTEGPPNEHPGQGTACRRFFFCNAYLELLWLSDADQARSPTTRPTRLYERLTGSTDRVVPLGVGVRPTRAERRPPFATWSYRPQYLPSELTIEVADAAPLREPMWFFLSFAKRPDDASSIDRNSLIHAVGFREITSVRMAISDSNNVSAPGQEVVNSGVIELAECAAVGVEIGFDHCRHGHEQQFHPVLPLTVKW